MTSLLDGASDWSLGAPTSASASRPSTPRRPRPAGASTTRWSTTRRPSSSGRTGRLRLSADHTVVALAGATGSGKSSTFNALIGLDLAAVGVRRPTTSWAHRLRLGDRRRRRAARLARHPRAPPDRPRLDARRAAARTTPLEGWCCSTCPTTTRPRSSHHLEVDRLVELADLLVWVLDPQKYADAAIHDRYLAPLAGHRDVMVVVLNHIDTVPESRRDAMLADVRRLLDADGLGDVPVLGVSARHGTGIAELRERDRRPGGARRRRPGPGWPPTSARPPNGSTR